MSDVLQESGFVGAFIDIDLEDFKGSLENNSVI